MSTSPVKDNQFARLSKFLGKDHNGVEIRLFEGIKYYIVDDRIRPVYPSSQRSVALSIPIILLKRT
jgi:hypothetical protein